MSLMDILKTKIDAETLKTMHIERLGELCDERFKREKSSYNAFISIRDGFNWRYHTILKFTQFRFRGKKTAKELKVLEIGPGQGALSYQFKKAGLHVTCMDPSKECLAHCYNEAGVDEIMQGRIEGIPFAPESFDIIVASEVLQMSYNPRAAIQQCYRACKVGGVMFITVPMGREFLDEMTLQFFDFYTLSDIAKTCTQDYTIIKTNHGDKEGIRNTWVLIMYKNESEARTDE